MHVKENKTYKNYGESSRGNWHFKLVFFVQTKVAADTWNAHEQDYGFLNK